MVFHSLRYSIGSPFTPQRLAPHRRPSRERDIPSALIPVKALRPVPTSARRDRCICWLNQGKHCTSSFRPALGIDGCADDEPSGRCWRLRAQRAQNGNRKREDDPEAGFSFPISILGSLCPQPPAPSRWLIVRAPINPKGGTEGACAVFSLV